MITHAEKLQHFLVRAASMATWTWTLKSLAENLLFMSVVMHGPYLKQPPSFLLFCEQPAFMVQSCVNQKLPCMLQILNTVGILLPQSGTLWNLPCCIYPSHGTWQWDGQQGLACWESGELWDMQNYIPSHPIVHSKGWTVESGTLWDVATVLFCLVLRMWKDTTRAEG